MHIHMATMKAGGDCVPNTIIGERLQELRNRRSVNQEIAAEACGISRIALARYENGVRVPRMDTAAKLAQYYGVSVDYILGHEYSPTEQKKDPPSEREIDDAIAALADDLTPDELLRVADFVAGLKAARKP